MKEAIDPLNTKLTHLASDVGILKNSILILQTVSQAQSSEQSHPRPNSDESVVSVEELIVDVDDQPDVQDPLNSNLPTNQL